MAMQLYFLVQTYNLQSKLFDGQVNDALKNVVNKIEKHDIDRFYKQHTSGTDPQSNTTVTDITYKDNMPGKIHRFANRRDFVRDSLKNVRARLTEALADSGQIGSLTIRIRYDNITDQYGNVQQRTTGYVLNNTALYRNHREKLPRYDTVEKYDYSDPMLGPQLVVSHVRENPLWKAEQERKQALRQLKGINKILQQDSLESVKEMNNRANLNSVLDEYQKTKEPLKNRIDPLFIDSLLRLEMLNMNKGVPLPFSYEVTNANNDSLLFSKSNDMTGEKPVFDKAGGFYPTPIFVNDVINKDPGMLRLAFPKKNSHILSTMTVSMATSGSLLMVLIFCFGYTIFSILKQKKISEMKTDFINNMTHEFKTPVSTIMIASEALKDDEIVADRSRIRRLANIIYEENARLGSHIERVLNIARIEKDDFKLDIKPVDVNEMITDVLDSMALKLQKSNAETSLRLEADHATINADELHFSNVLYNLVDNAIKYSKETPHITITTTTVRNTLVITVADKGIGMSREEQARIFEQFYRIPTGNLHDVKGFGLGLSYVNTIVKRLDGTISVRSEKDKGSEFELRFPVV